MDLRRWLDTAVTGITAWEAGFGPFDRHPTLAVDEAELTGAVKELLDRLTHNYPYFHPRYAGQMMKPPHPVAVIGQVATMLINPNNHGLDGGPATAQMEHETIDQLAAMFGLPRHIGHLTTSGTIANLEALFVARESHPDLGIAVSADAHYTHTRMAHLLGMPVYPVPTDAVGRMDLVALEEVLRTGRIGTVVVTVGTTALGAVDPVAEVLALRAEYGVRVHVDAAYGGFFALIADDGPDGVASAPFRAIAHCDSVVVDPHKHGLQPYGCGAVLFADPSVGRFYDHDSPYTYFTSDEMHLGEISLECSRAGAAAAALWLTFRLLPPTPTGLGRVLRPGRRAALRWADLLAESRDLVLYQRPDLDIITFFPRAQRLSEIDALSSDIMAAGMSAPQTDAVFFATCIVASTAVARRGHDIEADVPSGRILRSVLMKPETEDWVPYLNSRVADLAATARGSVSGVPAK